MAGPISPHYILSTLPIGIIIRYPGKFVLHFWACDPYELYMCTEDKKTDILK